MSPSADIHAGAVRALVRRQEPTSHLPLIRHFAKFGEAEQDVLRESIRQMPKRMSAALEQAVFAADAKLCENACNIILLCRDYEMFPVLIRAAEDRGHRHAMQVTAALLRLANFLHQEATEKPTTTERGRRDPYFVRRQALVELERSLSRFYAHRRPEIVEAFLVLAPADNETFLRILRDDRHPCREQVVTSLRTSKVPGMMQRLVDLLQERHPPPVALEIVAGRSDRRFLEILLGALKSPVPLRTLANMRRLTSVAWLQKERDVLLDLDGRAQAAAVELAIASGISRQDVLELLTMLHKDGLAEGQWASRRALADFRHPQAKARTAADRVPAAEVRAEAAIQRSSRLPGDVEMMVTTFDAPLRKQNERTMRDKQK